MNKNDKQRKMKMNQNIHLLKRTRPNQYAKLTPVDIYRELWEGRNFELNSLWQRSVFLTAFLVLIFTGYALVWGVVLNDLSSLESTMLVHVRSYSFVQSIAFLSAKNIVFPKIITAIFLTLTILGIVFSLLWIYMTKGSKYWYEKYENSINLMLDNPEFQKLLLHEDLIKCLDKEANKEGLMSKKNPYTWFFGNAL